MSVRRTAIKGAPADRFGVAKGVAFWVFMFAASFIFGLLVVSPLINFAGGSRSEAQPATVRQSNQSAIQPSPTAPPSTQAPGLQVRTNTADEPGISVREDRSAPPVQRTEGLEEPRARQEDVDKQVATPPDDPAENLSTSEGASEPNDAGVTVHEGQTVRGSGRSERPVQPGPQTGRRVRRSETANPESKARRSTRTDEAPSPARIEQPAKPPVQQGESID